MLSPGALPAMLEWGVASRNMPGECVSGDGHFVKIQRHLGIVAAFDGIGHGSDAAQAAKTVAGVLEKLQEPIIPLFQHCHEALRNSRGAVMSAACFNAEFDTMTWLGVGNVQGLLLRQERREGYKNENLLLFGGVLGFQLPALRAEILPLLPGDLLVLATDGISSDLSGKISVHENPQMLAKRLCAQFSKGNDDALALVVRYTGFLA